MFTGIIEATAEIVEKAPHSLRLARPKAMQEVKMGASICVSGVCLSVIGQDASSLTFDVIPVTWSKSKLGNLHAGDRVNLEQALPAYGRFDGHIVQGHCEGVGTVTEVKEGEWYALTIDLPSPLHPFVVPHGSIAIDGVSLTVSDVTTQGVVVSLIPLTKEQTTLGTLQVGARVNIETDIVGRYVRQHTHRGSA